jgi:hypothetical protein
MRRGEDHEYINVMFSSTITQTAMKWVEKMYVPMYSVHILFLICCDRYLPS